MSERRRGEYEYDDPPTKTDKKGWLRLRVCCVRCNRAIDEDEGKDEEY